MQLRGLRLGRHDRESPARLGLSELLPHVGHDQILRFIRKYKSQDTEITGWGHHARLLATLCQATTLYHTSHSTMPCQQGSRS